MRKFLSVLALAVVTVGLIIAGICFAKLTGDEVSKYGEVTSEAMLPLGLTIGTFVGGIGTGIAAIANFFTAKTYDK